MARGSFGGGATEYVENSSGSRAAGVPVSMFNAETGGTQITDLLLGATPVTTVTSGTLGRLPVFSGPNDDRQELWADAGGGTRTRLESYNRLLAQTVAAAATGIAATDTANLQAAITANLHVVVPPGLYAVSSQLLLRAGQHFQMSPGTVLRATGIAAAQAVIRVDAVSDVRVSGGTLDGNKATYATGGYFGLMVLNGAKRVLVDGVTAKNFPGTDAAGTNGGDGFYIGVTGGAPYFPPEDVVFSACTADSNVRQGCSLVSGFRVRFLGCSFLNTTGTGPGAGLDIEPDALVAGVQDVTVTGCIFVNNTGGGVIVDDDVVGPVLITGNVFRGNSSPFSDVGTGVTSKGGSVVISGNSFDSSAARPAIVIRGAGQVVTGNRIRNGGQGVYLVNASNCTVSGNSIIGTSSTAILVDQRAVGQLSIRGLVVTGNDLVDCGGGIGNGAGFIVLNSSTTIPTTISDVTISGNTIVETRAGNLRADFGIRGDVTAAEVDTWVLAGNRVSPPIATRYSFPGNSSDRLTDHPTAVTGSRGANAALASLITALVQAKVITDSTVA